MELFAFLSVPVALLIVGEIYKKKVLTLTSVLFWGLLMGYAYTNTSEGDIYNYLGFASFGMMAMTIVLTILMNESKEEENESNSLDNEDESGYIKEKKRIRQSSVFSNASKKRIKRRKKSNKIQY